MRRPRGSPKGNAAAPLEAGRRPLLTLLPDLALALLLCGLFVAGLVLALSARGLVPGYDAVVYVNAAHSVRTGLVTGNAACFTKVGAAGAVNWTGLPFTNTLDVLLLAGAWGLLDYHLGVLAIHTAYLVLFALLARRLLGGPSALLLVVWAVSHPFFLHQYTSFLSEMKVGMLLALLVLALFHDRVEDHLRPLFWVTVLLLLLRAVDLFFVLPLAAAHAAFSWRRKDRPGSAGAATRSVGLACLVLSPLLAFEMTQAVPYLHRASYTDMAQNWRDMAGVSGTLSLVRSYVDGVAAYNRAFGAGAVLAAAAGALLSLRGDGGRLRSFRGTALGTAVVFAVLGSAQSNNLMIVYWVYALLGAVTVSLLKATFAESRLALLACALVPVAVVQNADGFARSRQALAEARPVMELARGVSTCLAAVESPAVFQNYVGIGPLDPLGLEVGGRTILDWVPVNRVSYQTPLSAHLAALDRANVALIANRNFMWPPFMGLNRRTEELERYVAENSSRLGFVKARHLLFEGDPSRFVDVYTRTSGMTRGPEEDRWRSNASSRAATSNGALP